jgi:hypothetical protein
VIHDKASFELSDLRLRIQHLEGTSELDAKDVLKPETLAKLLVEQWLAAGLSRELWARVQDTVQQQLVDVVVKAYESANAFLIANGVMQEIDLKSFVRRTGNAAGAGNSAASTPPLRAGWLRRPRRWTAVAARQRSSVPASARRRRNTRSAQASVPMPAARRRSAARR